MKNIILVNTLIIFLLVVSCKSYSNNNPNINHETIIKIKESVAITLSIQLEYDLHNYPANRDIDILIGASKSHKNLYFILIDYPKSIKRQNKNVYIVTNKLGNFAHLKRYKYKSLPKFFDTNIQTELEKTFVKEKITISKEKGQRPRKASPQSEALNKLAIKKLVSSIKNYIAQDNTLKQQFTLPFTTEIAIDEYSLIIYDEFVVAKLISKNDKHTIFGSVYRKDDNGKELNEYRFDKATTASDLWLTKRALNFSNLKIIDIK